MITLYHGTNAPFDAIDLKQSKRYKDFKRKHKGNIKSFLKGIKYIKGETFQYAFCTEKAVKYLKRI